MTDLDLRQMAEHLLRAGIVPAPCPEGAELAKFFLELHACHTSLGQPSEAQAIVRSAADAILTLREDGIITSINPAGERIFGYRGMELIGQSISLLLPGLGVVGTPATLTSAQSDTEAVRKNGQRFHVELSISDLHLSETRGYAVFIRDLEPRQNLGMKVHQEQKLEAVGQLAGGVAHDFNNLLTIINGYSQLLLDSDALAEPQRDFLRLVRNAGERAAELTRQLLAFGRRAIRTPGLLNLNDVLTAVRPLVEEVVGDNVEVAIRPEAEVGRIMADAGQIEQVILTLASNARDAMPDGGNLLIETTSVSIFGSRREQGLASGEYVRLRIIDSGLGMTPDVLGRVFEPFFTTKNLGKGTGMGLAMVYGIVKQSGGEIRVDSEPGKGSTFSIYLPAMAAKQSKESAQNPQGEVAHGGELILVAEDDTTVRSLVEMALQENGYGVLAAASAPEALHLANGYLGRIHLLLTDITMPGMNGLELAQRLRCSRPEVRVLFASGSSEARLTEGEMPEANFMPKPFTANVLLAKVREALDGR